MLQAVWGKGCPTPGRPRRTGWPGAVEEVWTFLRVGHLNNSRKFSNSHLNSLPAQPFTHFPLAANFAIPATLLKSFWLGNRPRHDEPSCSQSSPVSDGSPPRRPPARMLCLATAPAPVASLPTISPLRLRVSAVSPVGRLGLIHFHPPEPPKTPQFRSPKSAKTPAKPHYRQPS